MADAKLIGLDNKLAAMRALPAKIRAACEAQLDREAQELADAIKRAVPVKTGTLRDTVRVEPGDGPMDRKVVAGGKATTKKIRKAVRDSDFAKGLAEGGNQGEFDYARGVEFGHITPGGEHVAPRGFFFQTYRARKKAMRARMKAAARKAIRAEFPKGEV